MCIRDRLNTIQDNIKAWLPQARDLSVAEVIGLGSSDQSAGPDWQQEMMNLTETALQALMSAREREGARLALMLQDRIGQLRSLSAQAAPLIPQLVAQQRQRFMDRWAEAMALADGATMPEGLEDAARYPALSAGMLARGHSEQTVRGVLGLNFLRVFGEVTGR